MSLQSQVQGAVDRLVRTVGTTGTLVRRTRGAYNPATGGTTPAVEAEWPIRVIVTSNVAAADRAMAMGTTIGSDKRAIISARDLREVSTDDIDPAVGDRIEVGGVSYDIINVARTDVQNDAVVFICDVRDSGV